jgi:hypothetical protein
MKAALSLLLCGALLVGCGLVEDMKGMLEKAQLVGAAAEAVGRAFASRPEVIYVQIASQPAN